jgi:hypothetical protein
MVSKLIIFRKGNKREHEIFMIIFKIDDIDIINHFFFCLILTGNFFFISACFSAVVYLGSLGSTLPFFFIFSVVSSPE